MVHGQDSTGVHRSKNGSELHEYLLSFFDVGVCAFLVDFKCVSNFD